MSVNLYILSDHSAYISLSTIVCHLHFYINFFFFFNDTATTDIYTLLLTCIFFFFNDTATTEIYTLSLHDALPISGLLLEREDLFRVEAFLAVDAALRVGDRHDLRALLVVHQTGIVGPDVPESLDRDARAFQVQLEFLAGLAGGVHHAARRRLVPAERTADDERLARDDPGPGGPFVHRDRVHDPCQRLAVRVHVRRGDVLLRSDDDRDFRRIPARHALELVL